jgi:hypothetical protein
VALGNQSSITAGIIEASEVLCSRCDPFAGELQETILMNQLDEVGAELKPANMLQPLNMEDKWLILGALV